MPISKKCFRNNQNVERAILSNLFAPEYGMEFAYQNNPELTPVMYIFESKTKQPILKRDKTAYFQNGTKQPIFKTEQRTKF